MVGALIVAAGSTARGGGLEPMASTGVVTAVQRLILTFRQAGIDEIVVVASHEDEGNLEKNIARYGAVLLREGIQEAEMLDSVKAGLRYMKKHVGAALITPVDVPLFTVETVQLLLNADASVAAPQFNGKGGHPLYLDAQFFDTVLAYGGEDGLRGALYTLPIEKQQIPVSDEGVVLSIRQDVDIRPFVERHSLRKTRAEMRLQLAREQVFFGPGSSQLIRLIENTGSVRLASELMGISYSKAWKILALMEDELGYKVVERQQGGKNGGRAFVTEAGKALLEKYMAFVAESQEAINTIFKRYFDE